MKIIFSTYEAKEIGGSYLRALSLAQGLVNLNHSVTLWTSAKKVSLLPRFSTEKGVLVCESIGLLPHRFRKGGYDPFDLLFRSLVILFTKCDVINSFNHRPAATFPAWLKTTFHPQTKWFLDWADLWGKGGIADRRIGPLSFITKNFDHYMERFFIKLADVVTPISDDLLKKAKVIRGNQKKTFFLGVGANIEGIQPIPQEQARKKLAISIKDKILIYLYVGTYDEDLLAKTFTELCKLRSDVKLMLLGPNLPLFEQILQPHPQVSKLVLREGVLPRELLAQYLSAGDLMLMPFANKEINLGKFPNKLGDYLASGRPIVGNPTGEVKKLLDSERVGMLFSENPKKFAQGISKLLDDEKKMRELGKNARLVAENFSWLSVAKQLESFYLK